MKNLKKIPRKSLINILVRRWLLAVLFLLPVLLLAGSASAADPTAAIQAIETLILPTLERATAWSYQVGISITASFAFYALVVRLSKMGS